MGAETDAWVPITHIHSHAHTHWLFQLLNADKLVSDAVPYSWVSLLYFVVEINLAFV